MSYTTIITIKEAAELLNFQRCLVIDCSFELTDPIKGKALYTAAHIPGAAYMHLDEDLAGSMTGNNGRHPLPDPEVFSEKLRASGMDSGDQVIAYDNAGGPFAARLWWLLRWLGHDNVAVMDGKISDWIAAGHAVETGPPKPLPHGNFSVDTIRHELVVNADLVEHNIFDPQAIVLDARSAERFRGEVLIMDAVAGHIPGARNRPFIDNLNAAGRFKTPDELRGEFESKIDGFTPSAVILQCGSGVTACHNALAMHHAGMIGARLYPGSWSEWASDPARPVELSTPCETSPI